MTDEIKKYAREIGITFIGVAAAKKLDEEANYLDEWLNRGYHATMEWMKKRNYERKDPKLILPSVQSIICCGINYYTTDKHKDAEDTGKISRYAWGEDYHLVLGKLLKNLTTYLHSIDEKSENKWYIDTGPIMEKSWAVRSGIGWLGKHSNVITKINGSWIFLGIILTSLKLEYDKPLQDYCGSCSRCIDACPTQAIVESHIVDSRKCLSYLTIEHCGEVSASLQQKYKNWIYGCDVCQDVCPWNQKFSKKTEFEEFSPRSGFAVPELDEWRNMTEKEFNQKFKNSAIKRTKLDGLRRNIKIVQENSQNND